MNITTLVLFLLSSLPSSSTFAPFHKIAKIYPAFLVWYGKTPEMLLSDSIKCIICHILFAPIGVLLIEITNLNTPSYKLPQISMPFFGFFQGPTRYLNFSVFLSRQMHRWNHTTSPSRYFADLFLEFLRLPLLLKQRSVA